MNASDHPIALVTGGANGIGLCAFLLSDAAGFITGENIVADGGMTRRMLYTE